MEASMQEKPICPYYGCDEDQCDVGCGYITSHDAHMIIRFCSSQFDSCHKFRELADRYGLPDKATIVTPPVSVPQPQIQDVPVLGLLSFGLTVVLYALTLLPLVTIDPRLLGLLLFTGSLGQIITGLSTLKKNPLRAVAFTGFGLFWLSMVALDVLPHAGFGKIPGQLPMVGYLAMWGLFSLIICQGMESLSKICRLAFAMLTAFLMLLAIAHATNQIAVMHTACLMGIGSGLPGLFLGGQYLWREISLFLQPELTKSGRLR